VSVPDPAAGRRVLVTSSVRWAWVSEVSSYLRVIDLEQERVTFLAPVPESRWREHDPNPRGGARGARGISVHGDRLVVANGERLFVFDTSWQLVDQLSHPMLSNVHDILAEENGIWATACGCDMLVRLSWEGQLEEWWSFRDDRGLYRKLGYHRRNLPRVSPDLDYRDPRVQAETADLVHLNGVVRSADGLLLSFGCVTNTGEADAFAIVGLADKRPRRSRNASLLLHRRGVGVPNHNIGQEGDLLVYNDSNANRLVAVDASTGEERISVDIPGDPGFARGLARIGPGRWLVGSQAPLAIYALDLRRGEIVATYPLGGVENETVYGICVLPDAFGDPPPVRMTDEDPYAFWRQVSPGTGFTPVPA
jgi:hypothetical protein